MKETHHKEDEITNKTTLPIDPKCERDPIKANPDEIKSNMTNPPKEVSSMVVWFVE